MYYYYHAGGAWQSLNRASINSNSWRIDHAPNNSEPTQEEIATLPTRPS
jgi:hypothetical protein